MKKKGIKGRKPIGPERKYACSDIEYARIKLAAKLTKKKPAAIARDATIQTADTIIRDHVEALRSLEISDELMREVAAEYLAGQATEPAQAETTTSKKSAKKKRS